MSKKEEILFSSSETYLSAKVEEMAENIGFNIFLHNCLNRHFRGDWGSVDDSLSKENSLALKNGDTIFSFYTLPSKQDILCIVTRRKNDKGIRPYTTILFLNEV